MDHRQGPIVLVVDDNADCRELVAAVLGRGAIATVEAGTCEAALQRMRESPTPWVVIVDLQLPDCHGSDLIRAIRANPFTTRVPVLVLSALVTDSDRRKAAAAGAAGFMAKPVLPDEVLEAVRRALPAA